MGGHLGHPVASGERRHDKFHLDSGMPGAQIEAAEYVGADGAETVLGVGEARAETAVDEISDEGRTGETEKFVAAAMKFVGATEETGAADVVGHTRFDGRDERGNIDRIMRAVGIDEDADGRGDLSDGETEGGAFSE